MGFSNIWCSGVVFSILPASELHWYTGSGVYMFCRREWDGSRTILYIGEAENVAARMKRHEKLDAAVKLRMNELHVHMLTKTKRERLSVETYLRRQYATPLNEQTQGLQALGLLGAVAPRQNVNALLDAPLGLGKLNPLAR